MKSIAYKTAEEVTKKSRSNFFSAFRFLEKEKRVALMRVYAFARIIDDAVDEGNDNQKKKEALKFWKTELTSSKSNSHPVIRELKESMESFRIPEKYFLDLIKGCEMDLVRNRYDTWEELLDYCYHVASTVGLMCLKIFEYNSPTASEMAINLGYAFQITNIIRDVGTDLDIDRIYIPKELLKKFNVTENDLRSRNPNDNFKILMEHLSEKSQSYYNKAATEYTKDTYNKLLPAKIMTQVYHGILCKIQKQNFPVLKKRVSLNFFEKTKILLPAYFRKAA